MTSDPRDLRICQLETLCRRQQAAIGALQDELRRTSNELTVAQAENQHLRARVTDGDAALLQEHEAHRRTRENLAELLQQVSTIDERMKAHIRRAFLTASERAISDPGQQWIHDVLKHLRDERDEDDAVVAMAAAAADASEQAADTTETVPDETSPEAQHAAQRPVSKRCRPANAGGRKPLPDDLPREESVYHPPADHPMLAHAESATQIGTTVIQRLDIPKVRVVVQVMTCPVYQLTLRGGITAQQTVAPPGVIERGQVSDRFLVTSAIDKVQDHLPANRQQNRFARIGVEILRSKLCRWHIALGQFLEPVAEAIFDEIRAAPVVGIDDTVHRLIDPERHVCRQGRIIAVSGPAGIFYQFQETREGRWFTQLLETYSGAVMGDAYSGHGQILARDDILALFCWAHARRKFFESGDTRRRAIILEMIGRLYAIEDDIATQPPDARIATRRQRAGPVLAQIHELLTSWEADRAVLPQTGIGKATRYVLTRWDGFTAYLNQAHAPIDNNRTERGMRPNALHRKNSLFSASRAGAEAYATLLTVCQSAWLHSLDPHAYLLDVLDQMHHHRQPAKRLTPTAYATAGKCVVGARS